MTEKVTRAEQAGRLMGRALVAWVHLFYQDNTALNLFKGLLKPLQKELARREKAKAKKAKSAE